MSNASIRCMELRDVETVVGLIYELAEYQRAGPRECMVTVEQLRGALFCEHPALFGHVAVVDGAVVGYALWFLNFSTWLGEHGIYLEDLYVQPEHRSKGLGKLLLAALAEVCVSNDYQRLEWIVLDWNIPAFDFYRSVGAVVMDDCAVHRLVGDDLKALAQEA